MHARPGQHGGAPPRGGLWWRVFIENNETSGAKEAMLVVYTNGLDLIRVLRPVIG